MVRITSQLASHPSPQGCKRISGSIATTPCGNCSAQIALGPPAWSLAWGRKHYNSIATFCTWAPCERTESQHKGGSFAGLRTKPRSGHTLAPPQLSRWTFPFPGPPDHSRAQGCGFPIYLLMWPGNFAQRAQGVFGEVNRKQQ